jgi:hypothetical protein
VYEHGAVTSASPHQEQGLVAVTGRQTEVPYPHWEEEVLAGTGRQGEVPYPHDGVQIHAREVEEASLHQGSGRWLVGASLLLVPLRLLLLAMLKLPLSAPSMLLSAPLRLLLSGPSMLLLPLSAPLMLPLSVPLMLPSSAPLSLPLSVPLTRLLSVPLRSDRETMMGEGRVGEQGNLRPKASPVILVLSVRIGALQGLCGLGVLKRFLKLEPLFLMVQVV